MSDKQEFNNKEEILDDELYENENLDGEEYTAEEDEKKKKKKGFLYWLITGLLILSIIMLICVVGYTLYKYVSLKYTTTENANVATEKFSPITCDKKTKKVSANYTQNSLSESKYSVNEQIGYVNAPTVKMNQPIYVGDPKDKSVKALDQGAAFDTSSFLPQTGGYTVLSGHREFVFNPLKDIKEGDPIVVNIDGQIFTYVVSSTKIIDENDVNSVFLNDDSERLVLYTCYPFFLLLPYTERFVVYADPVESVEYPDC